MTYIDATHVRTLHKANGMECLASTIHPSPLFSLELTANYQTSFQGEVGADTFENGIYRRLLEWDNRLLLLSVQEKGCIESSNLEITIVGEKLTPSDLEVACRTASHLLATDLDLRSLEKITQYDPFLSHLSKKLTGLRPPRMPSIFEGLVFAISGQQISSNVARQIRTLLVKRFGPSIQYNGKEYHAFPSPQKLIDVGRDGLQGIKLSRRKAEYILSIASHALEGELDLDTLRELPNRDILERLDALPGVGRWTAEWVLARAVGRQDIFPAGDLALRRILSTHYFQGYELSEDEAREFSERWGLCRTVVLTYLLAAYRLEQIGKAVAF